MKFYKYTLLFLYVVSISNLLHSSNRDSSNSIIGKQLNYKLKYKNINAGKAFISINSDSTKNLNLLSNIETNNFLDIFYKIRDKISVKMSSDDFSLIEVTNDINEGKYKKKHHAIFDSNQMKIISDKKYLEVNNKVHTPLSSIFSLQSQKLKINDIYTYNIYNLGKLKEVNISVLEKEKIKTPFGSYQSIVVSPKSMDGTHTISNKGDMKIWFSDDEKQIPLKIEIKIKHGSISLLLESIEQ